MSRGSLELVFHYRSDSHLIKEHRVRMEVPGKPFFDMDEKEMLGVTLQDAKKGKGHVPNSTKTRLTQTARWTRIRLRFQRRY